MGFCELQEIVLPTESKHFQCKKLFLRGDEGAISRENRELYIGYGQTIDFTTYINGCSYGKWKKYTHVGRIILNLSIKGRCIIRYVGYHLEFNKPVKVDFAEKNIDCLQDDEITTFTFPQNDEMILGFEISGLGDCVFKGGVYKTEISEGKLNKCELAIATTTCKKEEYITGNVRLIQKELLEPGSTDIADHLFIHVVDNGRTLKEDDVNGKNTFLHSNPNLGGSGGYARGMYEALHQDPKATNVLLMDDDVMVLPESVRRIYNFLRLLKDEYKDHFISGAMLFLESPNVQWEDIGTILDDYIYRPLKRPFNHENLVDNLLNEKAYPRKKREHAAWWYCCIPVDIIERYGYPLPLFLRCDDSEYSLRCNAKMITMNGICIWHMGFEPKWNNATDLYMQYRNFAIVNAMMPDRWDGSIWKTLWEQYYFELTRFNYLGAEIMLKAIGDYLKGPHYLCCLDAEKLFEDIRNYNEKMVPIADILEAGNLYDSDIESAGVDDKRRFISKVIYHLTDNGQSLLMPFRRKKTMAIITANNVRITEKITLHTEALAINVAAGTAVYRKLDRKKYLKLRKEAKRIKKVYMRDSMEINKQYLEYKDKMTSEEFWISKWEEC